MKDIQMQERGLSALAKQGQPQFFKKPVWVPYTSSEIGNYYIQSVAIENDGKDYQTARNDICMLAENFGLRNFDAISGGGTRDWDFSNAVAPELGVPHAKLYDGKDPIGAKIEGRRFLHVADLNNEGSSMRDKWVPTIKKYGGEIVHAIFYVDRMEKGVQVMNDLGISNEAVVSMDANAWDYLLKIGYIDENIKRSCDERLKNPKAWAHAALRENQEPLIKMINSGDKKKIDQARKMLYEVYPEVKDEVLEKLAIAGHEFPREV